jgi:hypothetical protein
MVVLNPPTRFAIGSMVLTMEGSVRATALSDWHIEGSHG